MNQRCRIIIIHYELIYWLLYFYFTSLFPLIEAMHLYVHNMKKNQPAFSMSHNTEIICNTENNTEITHNKARTEDWFK